MPDKQQQKARLKKIETEKMSALGQMVAGIAHEINNPITFIYLNLQTIRSHVEKFEKLTALQGRLIEAIELEETATMDAVALELDGMLTKFDVGRRFQKVYDLLAGMAEGTERVMKIIDDLRNFSTPGAIQKEPVNITEALQTTINIIRHHLHAKDRLHLDLACGAEVMGYRHRINQVFLNLLLNACQATEHKVGERVIRIRTARQDGDVLISIQDNGKGIPEEIRSRIFEPFFTTKRDQKGVGLGLSNSYVIIEDHHGSIEVASPCRDGSAGAEFLVKLPVFTKEMM